ncbi:MAG: hypothetical protein KDA89_03965, partial [Planctomycetaceae bacterium]|nr:hypothetical protein [Planctomycetaceae bacterium]
KLPDSSCSKLTALAVRSETRRRAQRVSEKPVYGFRCRIGRRSTTEIAGFRRFRSHAFGEFCRCKLRNLSFPLMSRLVP